MYIYSNTAIISSNNNNNYFNRDHPLLMHVLHPQEEYKIFNDNKFRNST